MNTEKEMSETQSASQENVEVLPDASEEDLYYDQNFRQGLESGANKIEGNNERPSEEKETKNKRRYSKSEREALSKAREQEARYNAERQYFMNYTSGLQQENSQYKSAYLDSQENYLDLLANEYKLVKAAAMDDGNTDALLDVDEKIQEIRDKKRQIDEARKELAYNWNQAPTPPTYYSENAERTSNESKNENNNLDDSAWEAFENWKSSKPWMDKDNKSYSRHLESKAIEISADLERRLKYEGRSDILDTPEFYNLLDEEMNNRVFNATPSARSEPKSSSNHTYVSPVNNGGITFGSGRMQGRSVNLDDEQREQAHAFGRRIAPNKGPAEWEKMYKQAMSEE